MFRQRKNVIKIIFIILCIPLLFSCFDADEDNSCSITIDSVNIIDSVSTKNKTYYLVYRISGWSDKTEILELYDKKPTFDHCSNSNIEPVFGDSLELTKIVSHVYLNLNQNNFEIKYKEGTPSITNSNTLKLELR